MTTTLTIGDRVCGVIAEHLGKTTLDVVEDARLEDLGADSLDLIELQVALEEEMHIAIEDEAVDGWLLVRDVVQTVEGLR